MRFYQNPCSESRIVIHQVCLMQKSSRDRQKWHGLFGMAYPQQDVHVGNDRSTETVDMENRALYRRNFAHG